jgi:hypothetical protein
MHALYQVIERSEEKKYGLLFSLMLRYVEVH